MSSYERGAPRGAVVEPRLKRTYFLGVPFDHAEPDDCLGFVANFDAKSAFRYVVTPNVDHVIRINHSPEYFEIYENAVLSINDSRILGLCSRLRGATLLVLPGSDLVAAVFDRVLQHGDAITIIGGDSEVVERIRKLVPGVTLRHHTPPMGFIHDPEAVRAAVEFVVTWQSRFVFFAVGSPQQEVLAARVCSTGSAVGLGLCVGSALLFLAGIEQRAPLWLQHVGLEWAYRLYRKPQRLWRRYFLGAPLIAWLLLRDIVSGKGKRPLGHGARKER